MSMGQVRVGASHIQSPDPKSKNANGSKTGSSPSWAYNPRVQFPNAIKSMGLGPDPIRVSKRERWERVFIYFKSMYICACIIYIYTQYNIYMHQHSTYKVCIYVNFYFHMDPNWNQIEWTQNKYTYPIFMYWPGVLVTQISSPRVLFWDIFHYFLSFTTWWLKWTSILTHKNNGSISTLKML